MSGDGEHRQEKQNNEDIGQERDDEETDAPRSQRPMTARSRTQRRSRTPDNEPDPPGAVGGEGSSYLRNLNEQEKRVGGQAHMLLEMFILDRSRRDPNVSQHRDRVQSAVCQDMQQDKQNFSGHGDDHLKDVALALRDIGDQLAEDNDLNRLIDMVPIQSPKEIFMKVCKQMFDDGQFNWGRVVALFYFAYRLIAKAVVSAVDTIPWIKEIFSWAMDFFCQYVAWWIIQRGGWRMIREYWGTSSRTLTGLGVMTVLTVFYVWWKQQ